MFNNKIEYPTLYARSETGAVLEWDIIVEGDGFYTITGHQNGKKITSGKTICLSKNVGKKNETSAHEQAILEAEAKWKKKLKSGGYWENISEIDKGFSFVQPMLANHFKDHCHKITYPVIVDVKLNGMRQVTTKSGPFTRKGEPIITAPHIVDSLRSLFSRFPKLVLDGELYNHIHRSRLNELIKLVRKTKHFTDEDLEKSKSIVKYYVYDGYGFEINGNVVTQNSPCDIRRECLKKLLSNIKYIENIEYNIANSEDEVYEIYNRYISEEYEGAIVRTWNSPYQHKRTNDLLKVKPEDDDEGVIISIHEGTGNWAGAAKTATIKWKNETFDATFISGTHEEQKEILKEPNDWIGKKVTFYYIGLTGKGIPNSARIDIHNCFKGDR